ncbi:putative transcription antitermination regulator [Mycobacterium kiyosense]|nr:putative transcription antitermination regulator [Mycobacterium kiyosense]BDE12116.1 putative transcription antitermination regulator [Mycobacterium sp. 20KCMC460]GLB88729.1 putative transcription antitermination regulator [Mycobacterium kiyosense]GLB95001.1 putative transcription antitermination regulator [Mycobacterium kiyosense]GLC01896.1 putative transcription antitermination regulator [Mycobacterium kiyosense]
MMPNVQRAENDAAAPGGREQSPDPVLAPGAGPYLNVGSFRFWFVGQHWEWSDEVARMHGYEPGDVQPTTELLLSHKHPDDRAHVQDLLDYALRSGEPFSSRHRFIDTAGNVHDAIVVADRMVDDSGAVLGTAGHYIDLTETLDETRQEVLDEALPDLFDNRAVIEQAKGVLMFVYRVSADQAFRVLQWRSQETNTKLRGLATQLLAEVARLESPSASVQGQFDHLLLTVHERIPAETETG